MISTDQHAKGAKLGIAWFLCVAFLVGFTFAEEPSQLQLLRAENQTLEFSFHAATGWVHRIEYAEQLGTPTTWHPLPSFDAVTGDGALVTHQDDQILISTAPHQFFRLRSEWSVIELPDPLVLYEFTGSAPHPQEVDPEISASAFAISSGTLGFGSAAPEDWEECSSLSSCQ